MAQHAVLPRHMLRTVQPRELDVDHLTAGMSVNFSTALLRTYISSLASFFVILIILPGIFCGIQNQGGNLIFVGWIRFQNLVARRHQRRSSPSLNSCMTTIDYNSFPYESPENNTAMRS